MIKNIIKKSIEFYGKDIQSIVCMEECSELIQCISKELRGKSDIAHLTEEMADVLICVDILKQIYNISDEELNNWIKYKQERILNRIQGDIEND